MQYLLSLITLLTSVTAASDVRDRSPARSQSVCNELEARFPKQLFVQSSQVYNTESTDFWSKTTVKTPSCVFEPLTPQDVSEAVVVCEKYKSPFAVRGRGHMPVPGAASTDNGVLIVMTKLKTLELSTHTGIAQLGPGNQWVDVYDWISSYGLGIVGGRFGPVGVGGLLIGGGINYFGNKRGWAVNNVANYQIVLADGSIVDANAHSHSDLFWALKGGGNRFGVITRYDVYTYPVTDVYGGNLVVEQQHFPEFLDSLSSFIQPAGGAETDNEVAIMPSISISPSDGIVQGTLLSFRNGSDAHPASLANFTKLPTISNTNALRTSFADAVAEQSTQFFADESSRWLFWSTSLKSTPETIRLVNETYTAAALNSLKHIQNITYTVTFQPITKSWLEAAKAAGGDAIDLDPANGSFIALNLVTQWTNPKDDEAVYRFNSDTTALLEQRTKAAGIYYPYIYLNDAAKGQDPFPLYGGGKSLLRMKSIQKKYDPKGTFKTLMVTGFDF